LTQKIIKQTEEILKSSLRKEKMVNHNYRVAARHYSYHLLEEQLVPLLNRFTDTSDRRHSDESQIEKPCNILQLRDSQIIRAAV